MKTIKLWNGKVIKLNGIGPSWTAAILPQFMYAHAGDVHDNTYALISDFINYPKARSHLRKMADDGFYEVMLDAIGKYNGNLFYKILATLFAIKYYLAVRLGGWWFAYKCSKRIILYVKKLFNIKERGES